MLTKADIDRKKEENRKFFKKIFVFAAVVFAIFTPLYIFANLSNLPEISENRNMIFITIIALWCASSGVFFVLLFKGIKRGGLICPLCRETISADQWNRMTSTQKCPNCHEIVMR